MDSLVVVNDGGHSPTPSTQIKKNTVLTSHGRPPWYGHDGKVLSEAFVIGIAGGSASGKTHVARHIVRSLGLIPTVVILSQDSFYKQHSEEDLKLAFANEYDFDHPDSIDMPLFASCLADLKACRQTNIPIYSFAAHQRLDETKYLYGATIIITEGIMALHDPALRQLYDLKIFVQCDSDLMLARRIKRDIQERGRSVEGILDQYLRFVKPSYDNFVLPSAKYADIIVPGQNNTVAIDLICTHIVRQLQQRSIRFNPIINSTIGPRSPLVDHRALFDNSNLNSLGIHLLKQTPQLKGIYTILRDKNTPRQEFRFFLDRLSTLLVEKALEFLPFKQKTIVTPTGSTVVGLEMDAEHVCGVTILRSGGPLEQGLRRAINDIRLGSLLVQSDSKSGEALLLHSMLPRCLQYRPLAKKAYVFLLDSQIGTAAAAFMAIRVLLDHGVSQDRIIFVTFILAFDGGVSNLRRAFPGMRIITGAVDRRLRESRCEIVGDRGDTLEVSGRKIWIIEPGMGQIGDRYYL